MSLNVEVRLVEYLFNVNWGSQFFIKIPGVLFKSEDFGILSYSEFRKCTVYLSIIACGRDS